MTSGLNWIPQLWRNTYYILVIYWENVADIPIEVYNSIDFPDIFPIPYSMPIDKDDT